MAQPSSLQPCCALQNMTCPILKNILHSASPPLFLISQGTSLLALLIHNSPNPFPHQAAISTTIFLLSFALLCIFVFIYSLRVLLLPSATKHQLLNPPTTACTLASVLITLESNTSYLYFVGYHKAARVLFWVEAVLAVLFVASSTSALIILPRRRKHLPPALLLPTVSIITCAATGSVVGVYHPPADPESLAVPVSPAISSVSHALLGFGLTFAYGYSFFYLSHMMSGSYRPANRKEGMAAMLLIGPFGQGAFALTKLGKVGAADWLLFGYASFWMCIGGAETVRMVFFVEGGVKTWKARVIDWEVLFPVGVFTSAAEELSRSEDLLGWKVFALIWLVVYGILWTVLVVEGVFMFQRFLRQKLSRRVKEKKEDGNV